MTLARRPWLKIVVIVPVALTLLGGLLLWVFWDSAYELSINPQRPFLTLTPPKAPDYDDSAAWAALPGRMDSADLSPPGPGSETAGPPVADVFFIYPTTYTDHDDWNLSYRFKPAGIADHIAMPNLASAFAHGVRLYAPRYRAATPYAFRTRSEDSRLAQRFAYDDVRRAFDHYLSHWNAGRPFVLVGAGQGGLHAVGLLQDRILGTHAGERLIATYVVGAAVPADLFETGPLRHLRPCGSADATGCVAVWSAFPWGADARPLYDRALIWQRGDLHAVADRSLLCVNPLSWRMDGVPVMRENNRGALPIGERRGAALPALVPDAAGAHCVDGILRVDRPADSRLRRDLLPGRPHNLLDVALFYESIRTNMQTRMAAYQHDRKAQAARRDAGWQE